MQRKYNIDIMRMNGDSGEYYHTPFLLKLVRHNLPILVFLAIGFTGMVALYLFYSNERSEIEIINSSAADPEFSNAISAPIAPLSKDVRPQPVIQRRSQSPGPVRIGLIAGHRGFDSGTLCSDGLTEVSVTNSIVERMVSELRSREINVDSLDEFDTRLDGYTGTALISVHVDSCDYINELATGFKISGSPYTDSSMLSICIQQNYADTTQLAYHPNSITPHMANYHAFSKIDQETPAIIIEIGFLNLDREILTQGSDVVVNALVEGISCFLEQDS